MRDVRRGEDALRAYLQVTPIRPLEVIVDEHGSEIRDVITDLLHLATHLDLNVSAIIAGAMDDWQFEVIENLEDGLLSVVRDATPEQIEKGP